MGVLASCMTPTPAAFACSRQRAGAAPRTPAATHQRYAHAGGRCPPHPPLGGPAAPRPPANDACCMIVAPVPAFVMPRHACAAAGSFLPVCMRARHSAYACIESGFPGAPPRAGGAGVAAHPCRPPRRRSASMQRQHRLQVHRHIHQALGTRTHRIGVPRGTAPGRGCRGGGPPLLPAT